MLVLQLATLAIMLGGVSLVLQQRKIASRLLAIGAALAAVDGLVRNAAASEFMDPIGTGPTIWCLAAGIAVAIFLGRLRLALAVAVLGFAVLAALPHLDPIFRITEAEFRRYWLVIVLVLLAPFVTALIVIASLKSLRMRLLATGTAHRVERSLLGLLDWFLGNPRRRRGRDRHIGEFGTTRRGRSGSGPHMI